MIRTSNLVEALKYLLEGGRHGTSSTYGVKTGWGTSGKLITGNTTKSVSMQANFPETGTYTIAFSSSGSDPRESNPIAAEALITWVVEGNYVSRRVNVRDGVSISGTGEAVKVIINDATTSMEGTPAGIEYGVACQISLGVRGSSKQPPTLVPRNTVPPSAPSSHNGSGSFHVINNTTIFVAIPQDAGAIMLFVTACGATNQKLFQGDVTIFGLANGTVIQSFDPFSYTDWVPLLSGVDQIGITNHLASGQDYNVNLTFGIDG